MLLFEHTRQTYKVLKFINIKYGLIFTMKGYSQGLEICNHPIGVCNTPCLILVLAKLFSNINAQLH